MRCEKLSPRGREPVPCRLLRQRFGPECSTLKQRAYTWSPLCYSFRIAQRLKKGGRRLDPIWRGRWRSPSRFNMLRCSQKKRCPIGTIWSRRTDSNRSPAHYECAGRVARPCISRPREGLLTSC